MRKHLTRARMRSIGALLGVAALGATLAPSFARADTVTDWNDTASTAIVGVAKQPPPVAVMSFAMAQGAVYDAVEAIDGRYRPYLATPPARRTDSADAAAATAAFRVLTGVLADLPPDQLPTCCSRATTRRSRRSPTARASPAASPTASRPRRRCSPRGTTTAIPTTGPTTRSRRCPAPPRAPGGPRRHSSPRTRRHGWPTSGRSWCPASTCCASPAPTR